MNVFTSEKIREDHEHSIFFMVDVVNTANSTTHSFYVTDTKKTWRGNDGWVRIIKNQIGQRITYARKSQMTPFDREIENYINQTYPLPQ